MAEYIEREEVLKTLDILFDKANDRYYKAMPHAVLVDVKGLMKTMDAADVAPVVHGYWYDKPNPNWKAYDIRYCSVCGWSIHKTKLRNADLKWHFCPNCGADMRERKGDDGKPL